MLILFGCTSSTSSSFLITWPSDDKKYACEHNITVWHCAPTRCCRIKEENYNSKYDVVVHFKHVKIRFMLKWLALRAHEKTRARDKDEQNGKALQKTKGKTWTWSQDVKQFTLDFHFCSRHIESVKLCRIYSKINNKYTTITANRIESKSIFDAFLGTKVMKIRGASLRSIHHRWNHTKRGSLKIEEENKLENRKIFENCFVQINWPIFSFSSPSTLDANQNKRKTVQCFSPLNWIGH